MKHIFRSWCTRQTCLCSFMWLIISTIIVLYVWTESEGYINNYLLNPLALLSFKQILWIKPYSFHHSCHVPLSGLCYHWKMIKSCCRRIYFGYQPWQQSSISPLTMNNNIDNQIRSHCFTTCALKHNLHQLLKALNFLYKNITYVLQ